MRKHITIREVLKSGQFPWHRKIGIVKCYSEITGGVI
jgi:hypothetical protein